MSPAPPPVRTHARFTELDGLRGIAALGVVLAHYITLANTFFPHLRQAPVDLNPLTLGVHLFFLISGFVIFMTVRRVGSAREFLTARAIRLFPPFWVALLLTSAIGYLSHEAWLKPGLRQFLANLTMAPKLFGEKPVDGAYWTLAVEWVFYLGMALLCALGLTRREQLTTWLLALWAVASVGLSVGLTLWRSAGSGLADVLLTATIAEYAPLFASGALLFLSRERGRLDPRLALTLPSALATALIVQGPGHAIMLAVPIVIFVAVVVRERTAVLRTAPLQFLGRVSYGRYLLHQNIGYAMISLTQDRVLGFLIAFPLTLGLAWALYELVEVRLSRVLRRRLLPRRRTA